MTRQFESIRERVLTCRWRRDASLLLLNLMGLEILQNHLLTQKYNKKRCLPTLSSSPQRQVAGCCSTGPPLGSGIPLSLPLSTISGMPLEGAAGDGSFIEAPANTAGTSCRFWSV